MKVLVAAAQFHSGVSGLQRHALNMIRCLLTQPEIASIHFVIAPWQLSLINQARISCPNRVHIHIAGMRRDVVNRNLWYYNQLPRWIARLQPDIAHLTYPVPIRAGAISCPTILTLHDLYPYEIPANFGFAKGLFNRIVLQQSLRNVDAIACVSDITKHRLSSYTSLSVQKKALRIYNCVEPVAASPGSSPLSLLRGDPFFLSIAQHRKNKNLPLLLRAFHRLLEHRCISPRTRLLIVGASGPETGRIVRLVSSLRLDANVSLLHGLSDQQLQWCYRECELMIAPSSTEGFGLPVAEALMAGCRVVCSDIPAFQEIGRGYCHFFPLGHNAEQCLIQTICEAMLQPLLSPRSLPQFSSELLGAEYLTLYRHLLSKKAARSERPETPHPQSPEGCFPTMACTPEARKRGEHGCI